MVGAEWDDGAVAWRSGLWALEVRGDEIADLTYGGRRVLRSVRAVVRDRDWNTVAWSVGEAVVGDRMLRVPVRSEGYGSDIRGVVSVAASGSGPGSGSAGAGAGAGADRLSVTFDVVSQTAFQTNRTGLVVLHPPQVSGAALEVRHPGGAVSSTRFPVALSAHQPVFDIVGLAWDDDGSRISIDFSGDVFEMEDQRNWTDASFKTYSRPLSLPFPYELAAGERVVQRIDVEVRPFPAVVVPSLAAPSTARPGLMAPSDAAVVDAEPTRIVLAAAGAVPAVGVAASSAPDPEPPGLPGVGGELLVELDLDTPNWPAALARAAARGAPLDVRVVLREPDRTLLDAIANALRGIRVARVAVFHPFFHVSVAAWVDALRAALAATGVEAPIVGGSRSHFTELNRERERMPADLAELVTTVTPQFHATSTAQLIESVAMQRLVARQTVEYASGRPVRIGPITLQPRFNDVATGPQPGPRRTDLAEGYGAEFTGVVDPRQATPELAAWTVASAAALAVPGVVALTYFEEWGPRGVRTAAGAPLPVASALDALASLGALDGSELLTGDSPDGLVWALGARTPAGATTILAANLDRRPRTLVVDLPSGGGAVELEALPPLTWSRREWSASR